ncbi:MAG: glycosyltransferase family 39 protein [Oligoflexia bacterium]|nr:glycosyltransferase family 39 protein [Oligoflexia bacterium]
MTKLRASEYVYLILVLLLALILRLDFLVSSNFVIDADEAIVGIMARHILGGEPIPIFYYGQHYMGSFEALVMALFFALFGSSCVVLKFVPLIFALLLVLVTYLCTREVAGRFAARNAALLMALPPVAMVEWSTRARGGFIEIILIGAIALWFTVRWLKSDRRGLIDLMIIAMVLGFGWWVNNQIVYFVLPIGFAVISRLVQSHVNPWRDVPIYLVGGLAAFIFGGLPFWIYNLQHDFVSLQMFGAASSSDSLKYLEGIATTAIPIILGGKRFWQTGEVFPLATLFVWLLYGGLLALLLRLRAKQIWELVKFRLDLKAPYELFLLFLLATIAVFALSSFGWLYRAPRYLLPMYFGVCVLCGVCFDLLRREGSRLTKAFLGLMLAMNLASFYLGGRAIPGEPHIFSGERVSSDHSELIKWLKENKYSWVKTNYWIGYRLAFETDEAIRFSILKDPYQARIESWVREGAAFKGDMPMILVPAQGRLMREAMQVLGVQYSYATRSGYDILYNVHWEQKNLKILDPSEFSVKANYHPEAVKLAVDGDLQTRWGSAHPQSTDMFFEIDFGEPQHIRGIKYVLAGWPQDYPRELAIEVELADGSKRNMLDSSAYPAIRYFMDDLFLAFDAMAVKRLILRQLGSDPVFDWSIAELQILE